MRAACRRPLRRRSRDTGKAWATRPTRGAPGTVCPGLLKNNNRITIVITSQCARGETVIDSKIEPDRRSTSAQAGTARRQEVAPKQNRSPANRGALLDA